MIALKITCKKCGSLFVITNSFQERTESLKCPSCGKEFTNETSDSLREYFKSEVKLREYLTKDKEINFEFASWDTCG